MQLLNEDTGMSESESVATGSTRVRACNEKKLNSSTKCWLHDQNHPSKTQFRKYQRGLTSTFVGYGGRKKITYRFSGKSQ